MAKWKSPIMQEQVLDETQESHVDTQKSASAAGASAKSQSILMKANEIIHGQRQEDYGPPDRSFDTIAKLWNIYLNTCPGNRTYITAADVAMMMVLLKVARTENVPTEDSLVDICGYAALAAECIDY